MILLLATIIVNQLSATTQLSAADLTFMSIVEDFARAIPPEPYNSLIKEMGSPYSRNRDIASSATLELSWVDPDALRWLFVGRRSHDPEIRIRCNGIICHILPCSPCDATGWSKNKAGTTCAECNGTGSRWQASAWD